MSCLMGDNRDIFFPKLSVSLDLSRFSDVAVRYLAQLGFEAYECATEDEARDRAKDLIAQKKWPCYFFASDTTGEKDVEEFFTSAEILDMVRFENIGIIKNVPDFDVAKLTHFTRTIEGIRSQPMWDKPEIVELFNQMIPEFQHKETGKYLDGRM